MVVSPPRFGKIEIGEEGIQYWPINRLKDFLILCAIPVTPVSRDPAGLLHLPKQITHLVTILRFKSRYALENVHTGVHYRTHTALDTLRVYNKPGFLVPCLSFSDGIWFITFDE